MRFYARAESVSVATDERGWELRLETEDGDSFVFGIHAVAFEFAQSSGLQSLLDWRAEGEVVRRLVSALDEDELLDADDPRQPDYAPRMLEQGDLLRKADRER